MTSVLPLATGRPIRVCLVVGEESGDQLGAALMRALRARAENVEFFGVGGVAMSAEGLHGVFDISDLSIVGFIEIIRHLRHLLGRIRDAADAVLAWRPDVLVIIDSPEFTHRVAARVRRRLPSLPIIDYVSPSVWAWRPWRARAMRRYVDHVLALLPFEPEVHRRLGGPPCTFIGHPLSERAGAFRPGPSEEQRRRSAPPLLLVLPGSRRGEIRRMLLPFSQAVELLIDRVGELEIVLPTLPHLQAEVAEAVSRWRSPPRVLLTRSEREAAFRSARVALAASGTVTLELALAGVPTVAAYRVGTWEALVARFLIQTQTVILANLVLGENIVPEFLQEKCTSAALANAVQDLLADGPSRQRQIDAFARIPELMGAGRLNPSERAAEVVLTILGGACPPA